MTDQQFQIIRNRFSGIIIILLLIFGTLAISVIHPRFVSLLGILSFYLSGFLLIRLVYRFLIAAFDDQKQQDKISLEQAKNISKEDTQ